MEIEVFKELDRNLIDPLFISDEEKCAKAMTVSDITKSKFHC